MRITEGVMIMKGRLAWGQTYSDGKSTEYGWMVPELAPIHDPKHVTKPTDVTYKGSPYTAQLEDAEIVKVRRTVTVEIITE